MSKRISKAEQKSRFIFRDVNRSIANIQRLDAGDHTTNN